MKRINTFLTTLLLNIMLLGLFQNSSAQTTLSAGDVAIIGYNTSGSPDNFAILVLKNLSAGTVFYINDNEVATGASVFTDLNEQEASFTVKAGQTISAGTVITLPWGAAAVSTTTYDYSSTSSAGLGNNNEEIYIYTATSITSAAPTAFIYFAKIGTSSSAIPSSLTLGSTAIAPSGSALRYVSGTYSGTQAALLSGIGNTSSNWVTTGATAMVPGDWNFTVTSCTTPSISSVSSNSPICEGSSLNLSLSVSGSAPLTYAWTGPNGFSSSDQNPTLPTAAAAATGSYSVTVSNACGSASSSVNATVNSLPIATITPDGPTTFCSGGSVTLTASSGASYLWSDNSTSQSIVVSSSGTYTVSVTNSENCSLTSTSTVVVVNPLVTPSVSISANPGSLICSGTNVTFTASPIEGGVSPNYQWKLNGSDVGTNSSTYSNASLSDADVVSCVLTSTAACAVPLTDTSNAITIQVSTSVTPSVSIASNAGTSICAGAPLTFTATAVNGGTSPTYQWKLNGNNVGSNSDSYTTSSLVDQDSVWCELVSSNSCASPLNATSTKLHLAVTSNVTPAVSISANPGNTICAGTSVTFTASPVNGGTAVYQWTKNGNNVGTNSITYTDAGLQNNDYIVCSITSSETCVTTSTAISDTLTMLVNPLPQPSITGSLTFCVSGSTTLDAGSGYSSYLWSTNETSQSIVVSAAGSYSVTVSNGTCSSTSAAVSVTEITSPDVPAAFTVSSATVSGGQTGVIYTVPNVLGQTYSWTYSGTGATINGSGNSVSVDFSVSASNGDLSVTASNACGTSTARTIGITVATAPTNLAIFVAASNTLNNTTASIVQISPLNANQTGTNIYSISGSGANAIRFSGSATSTGYLSNSNDGSLLAFTGVNNTNTTSNANTLNPRAVGTLNANNTFAIATTYTGTSGQQTRCATSLNNSNWFIGDQGGFYTNGTSTPSPTGNYRGVKSFGGLVYACTASATLAPVGTISAPSGATYTALPGLGLGATTRQDFYLISSGVNGSTFDVLYILDATSNTAGTIFKYSLVSGSWLSNGTYATSFGGFGLAAKSTGTGAELYVSTGQGALSGNNILKITDAAGYNTPIAITTANNVVLYTAAAGTVAKGVAFAPVCTSPTISSISSNSPICEGSSLNLSLSVSGSAPLTYAWTGPNGFSSSAQNPTLPSATAAATGSYSVTVSNACGSASSSITATVNSLPIATISPDGPTTFCAGGSVTLTASSGASYLWSDNSTSQSIVVSSSGTYTVSVTNSSNCSLTSTSTVVVVNPLVTPSVSISANPGSLICSGTNVTFTATPIEGGVSPNYQWKLNGSDVGTNSATYSNASLADADVVSCILTSTAACAVPLTDTSNAITIQVSTSVIPSVSIASNAGTSICAGAPLTFTATAVNGGASPTYQWKLNGNNVGTNSDSYTTSSLVDQDSVWCELVSSNSCASPLNASSAKLYLTVTPNLTPAVSISSNTGNTICAGTSVTFTASPVNGGTPVYQWTKNGNNVGSNSITYTDAGLQNNDYIVCSITSSETCVTTSTAISDTLTMLVNPLPQPIITGSLTFCVSGTTTLDAGSGYSSYLWSTNETSQSIVVNAAGSYSVTVSNGICSSTSAAVSVTEITSPDVPAAFTVSSATVNGGQLGVIYTVPNVSGLTYSWGYSGTGATITGSGNSVSVDFSVSASNGDLSVTASNACGTSTARTIVVTVQPLPGNMRITEYMYGGLGTGGEFVEFTNVGTTAVDMTGWSFDDNSRVAGSQSLTAFGFVQPGESVILTEMNAGTFRTNWNLCPGVKVIGGSVNNLGREDEVNLYDALGNLVDRLTYGDQTFSPGSIRTSGVSGKVSATGLGANTIQQWTLSVVSDIENSVASSQAEIGSPGKSKRALVVFDPCFVVNGTPTIVMDVTNTSNYIDGGVLVAPPSPYGLSGVINDPTDPSSTLGIDFTIADDVTPIANLLVTVASSNQTVVPNANLTLTGTGASRNLKISPVSIGYSNITLTVNDGLLSSSYVINFASSDPAPNIIPANTAFHTGMSDGSNGIALDDNYYISGDDEMDILNVYSRTNSGLPFVSYDYASNLALPDPSKPEVDVEAGTKSPISSNKIYWTGSMSNGKAPFDNKPNRDRLFATTVTGTGAATSFAFSGYVNIRTALLAWGDANGYNFTASAAAGVESKSAAGFSLEGMVFGPDGTTLYLGLRAPLVPTTFRHNAVIAPLLNFEAWFNNGAPVGAPTFGTPIELDLDYRGIRDITRLSNGTYILITGSPIDDGGINNIYKWSGYASDAPIIINHLANGSLNMEGVMQVNDLNGLSLTKLQIISDGGAANLYGDSNEAKDFADLKLRKFRSDVITGMDLDLCTGFAATITPSGSTTICSGDSVILAAPIGVNNTYLWSTGATSQTLSATAFQNYTVTVTQTTSGCSATSAPVTVSNALPADFNGDQVVNNIDFLQILGLFNQSCTGCPQDINKDGVVDNIDFLVILGQFNQSCN